MNNIAEVFKDKSFNEQTLELLSNFIEEFDDLFGKYLPKDELIKRIQENFVANVEFTNFEKKAVMGRYDHNEKRILIKEGLQPEVIKSVFFHEMIHCITARENYIGFPRGLSDQVFIDELEEKPLSTAIGITEGFTEYVNKKRNEKYGNINLDAYTILREQTENLADVIGEERFLDIAFNNPEELYSVMIDENIVDDEFDVDTFLTNFDIIHRFEEEILIDRILHGKVSKQEALLLDILGVKDVKKIKIEEAKSGIVTTLLGRIKRLPISTKEDFEEIQRLLTKYSSQLNLKDNYETCSIIFDKIAELEEGMPREEIFEMLPKESRYLAEKEFEFRDLMKLEPEELLEKMADPSIDIYEEVLEGEFEKHYGSQVLRKIFPCVDDKDIGYMLSLHLTENFAKTILDKGWNPKLMSFEIIDFDVPMGLIFNVYETDGEEINYLTTFSDVNQKYKLEEMRVCQATEKLKLLEENPKLDANSVLMVGKSGSILAYNGENNYSYVSDEKEFYSNEGNVGFFLSEAEQNQRLLKAAIERYKKMSQLYAPKCVLDDMGKNIVKRNNQRNTMKINKKFVPSDIEEATEGVTLEGLNKLLEELSEPLQTRKESLEKGIGYDE